MGSHRRVSRLRAIPAGKPRSHLTVVAAHAAAAQAWMINRMELQHRLAAQGRRLRVHVLPFLTAGEPVSGQATDGAAKPDGRAGGCGPACAGAALHGPCGAVCGAQGANISLRCIASWSKQMQFMPYDKTQNDLNFLLGQETQGFSASATPCHTVSTAQYFRSNIRQGWRCVSELTNSLLS